MNYKNLLATIAISAGLLTGCSSHDKEAIIKVNNQEITKTQFNQLYEKETGNSMFSQMGINVKKDPNSFIALMIKDKVVNELIIKSLIDQEIERRKIQVTQKDTDDELKNIIEKVGSKDKFNEILKQNGISSAQFKNDLVEEVKMKKLVNMLSKINITDADAKKFYDENKDQFTYPDKVRASHILISADPENIKQVITSNSSNKNLSKEEIDSKISQELKIKREKAEKILEQVKKSPADFAKIASENSEDPASAKKGGDLGYFSKEEMVEPFAKVAFSIKPNTVSEIVQTPYGYHIIIVQDRIKAGTEPFEKVKESIKLYLTNQAQVKTLENLIESLKKQAKIEYINQDYNPAKIQEALRKQAKNNPAAQEELDPASSSATPAPETENENK